MAYDTGFSRRSSSERDLQPVSIISVDPITRTAIGVTRTRHSLRINCAYATGDTITTPATGEQWYCERFDMEWRLYGRIPFNDATLNIRPEEGQVSVGSDRGPLELNGPEVRVNGKVFRLNGVYYRDDGTALQRSTDQVSWSSISAGDMNNLVPLIASALTDYEGDDQDGAIRALSDWGGLVQSILDNFSAFWNEFCQNVFVSGLKRMGFGDTDLAKIVDGFQNFIDYLFSILFCDFDGNLTPQTLLARLRDLLAPVTNNPFVLGLQQIAEILEVSVGNLLNDAVNGATELFELIFNIIFCRWDALLPQITKIADIIGLVGEDTPFGPATIIKQLFGTFSFLGDPNNPVGAFFLGLQSFFQLLFESTGSLLQDALSGAVQFVQLLFDVLFCQADPTQLAAVLAGVGDIFGPTAIIQAIDGFFQFFRDNPFVTGLQGFFVALTGQEPGNLIQDAVAGATEFVKLIFRILTCDLTVLTDLQNLVSGVVAGTGTPLGILAFLKPLLDGLLANPLVVMIQTFAEDILGNTGTLLEQLIEGTGDLMNLILKAVKTFLPFVPWSTLLPFVNWAAVDAAVFPSLTSVFSGFDPFDIFGPLDTLLGGAFKTFVTNLNSFFSGMGLLNGNFNPAAAVDYFLQNVLGLFNSAGEFLYAITADSLEGLGDWIQENIFNNVNPATFFTNLSNFLGTNPLSGAFNAATAVTTFLTNITTQLLNWIKANVFGNVNPATFFSNLTAMFGIDLRTGTFDPLAAIRNLIENFFNPDRVVQASDTGTLSVDILGDIGDFATDQIIRPIIVTLLTGSGIDLTKFGINSPEDLATVDLSVLGDLAGSLLTSLGQIPADLLNGLLPPATLGVIPVSNISNTSPNLITQGSFGDAISIESADGWAWDTTQNNPGSTGNTGSAKVTISTAKDRYLYSRQAIPVAKGDRLRLNAYVKTSGMAVSPAGSLPVTVALVPFIKNATTGKMEAQTVVPIGTAAGTAATGWTKIGQADNTFYEVTNANWSSVIVRLGVSAAARPLSFAWFDDISLTKTGALVQSNVDSLIAAFQATVGGLFGQGSPDTTADWTRLFAAAQQARGQADTANTNLGTTNKTLFNNTAGGSVFFNPAALIATLAGIKVDGSSTMATMIGYLVERLSQGTYSGSTADLIYWAAKKAADEAAFGYTRANYANQNLFGNPAGGNDGKVLATALPTTVGAVGSGIIVYKSNSPPIATTLSSLGTFISVGFGFYNEVAATTTGDVVYEGDSFGRTTFRALNFGWYMVEIGYQLNVQQWTYWWGFTPAISESRTGRVKYGATAVNARDTNIAASFTMAPPFAQASFIVYMRPGDTVRAGYSASREDYASGTANLIDPGSSGNGTYFSIALLNRSLV